MSLLVWITFVGVVGYCELPIFLTKDRVNNDDNAHYDNKES